MKPRRSPRRLRVKDRLKPWHRKTLKITQARSTIGARWKLRESLRTLGLRKIRQSVVREDNAQTRGLIKTVHHLVKL